jgi:hypothetical protein
MKMISLPLTFNEVSYLLQDSANGPMLVGPDGQQYAASDVALTQEDFLGNGQPVTASEVVNYGKLDEAIYEREPASDKPGCEEIGPLTDAARALIDLRYRFLAP